MDEARRIPISALQHWSYCPRQCALIYLDGEWRDNVLTARGTLAHERVDSGRAEVQHDVAVLRALTLFSDRLGLTGKADAVELPADGPPYPVEYKHGARHERLHDDIQLCAQALCLEEMLGVDIPCGAIYHHSSRRRREVGFTPQLRAATEAAVAGVRELLEQDALPPPVTDNRCRNCSLNTLCLPDTLNRGGWDTRWRAMFKPAKEDQ